MVATGFPAISTDSLRHVVEDMRRRAPNDENTLYADAMRLRLGADQDSSGRAWSRLLAAAPNNPIVLMNAAGDRFWVRADPAGAWPLMSRAVQLAPRNVEVLGAAAFTALYNGTICNDRSSRTGPAYLHEVVVDEPADRLGSC